MTELERLEKSVASLSAEDLARFREWFVEFDAQLWERQIERAASAGRLDDLIAEAMEEYRSGRTREI
jgi:hypothetical protein